MRHLRIFIAALTLAACVTLLGARASALGSTFPDQSDTSGQADVQAMSMKTSYVPQSNGDLRIWFNSSAGGTITVHNGHFCESNTNDDVQSQDAAWNDFDNNNITKFTVSGGGVTTATKYGRRFKNTANPNRANGVNHCNDNITFVVSGLTSKENGRYYVNISIDYVAARGAINAYNLSVNNGGIIGLPGGTSGYTTTQQQVDTTPAYTDYRAKFGTPCTISSSQTATLSFYDLDNGGDNGGAQPEGHSVTVRLHDDTSNSYVDFAGSVGTTWTPPTGSEITQTIDFTAQPYHKYTLEVNGVYYNNTIQYSLPYSQIDMFTCHPATGSIAAHTCSSLAGTANDADIAANQPLRVEVSVDGGGWQYVTIPGNSNSWSFSVTKDFYSHNYHVVVLGKADNGVEDGLNKDLGTVSIGPCLQVFCGNVTASVAQPEPGENFTISLSLPYRNGTTTASGVAASGRPTRPAYVLSLSGEVNVASAAYTTDGDSVDFTTGVLSRSTPGVYTLSFAFKYNGTGITPSACSGTIEVVTKPVLKVFGGDVVAGAPFTNAGVCSAAGTSAAITGWPHQTTYDAAGTQLGAIATGSIVGFSTAANFGGTVRSPGSVAPSALSFANTSTFASQEVYGGNYGSTSWCIPNYWGGKPADAKQLDFKKAQLERTTYSDTDYPVSTAATQRNGKLNGSYYTTGAAALDAASVLPSAAHATFYINGDLTIRGNIVYDRTNWVSTEDISALRVVVHGNIYIDRSVTQLDGVYIAQGATGQGGSIYTCTNDSTEVVRAQRATDCASQLTINGSFIAGRVVFDRTSGTARNGGPAAEQFNYLPELWLAPWGTAGGDNSQTFDALRALPPIL